MDTDKAQLDKLSKFKKPKVLSEEAKKEEVFINKDETDNKQVQNPDFLWTLPEENNE